MILRTAITGIVTLLLFGCGDGESVTERASFLATDASSDRSAGHSCEAIAWASDSVFVVTAGNKQIQVFDSNSGKELGGQEV